MIWPTMGVTQMAGTMIMFKLFTLQQYLIMEKTGLTFGDLKRDA